jgi:calmodulin
MRKAFEHFDSDNDGYITSAELRKAMKRSKMLMSKSEIAVMMREADRDGDGRVNFEEFMSMMMHK